MSRSPARLYAVCAVALALAGLGRIASTEIVGHADTRASDALPLYLSGAAVAAGLDPTQERSLAEVYDARGLTVGAATFSTLYPATAGVLMRPLAALDWPTFTTVWRWILLAAVGAFGVAAAWIAEGSRWRRVAWGGAVAAVFAWHPVTAECVRLGQVNLVLGALAAGAMAAVGAVGRGSGVGSWGGALPRNAPPGGPAPLDPRPGTNAGNSAAGPSPAGPSAGARSPEGRRRAWAVGLLAEVVAGAALGLGGALKLVPGALLLPLLATRRWRPAAAAAVVGMVALAFMLPSTSIPRFIEAIRGTLRFQAAIDPDWLVGRDPAPEWMRVLGFVRHEPLQWITLGAAAVLPAARPSARTALAGAALVCAWLGADAAGFHVLYAPLAYPAFLLLVGRPARFVALAAAFYTFAWLPDSLGAEPRMVLFGLVAWAFAAWELGLACAALPAGAIERDPETRQAGIAVAGVAVGVLLAGAMPGEGPVAAPLPEGQTTPEGPGFIHANDRVPGEVRALGGGLDRPASTLARPGTIRGLQLYMRRAPVAWTALAERYPARASLLRARADASPSGDLRDHSGREIAAWLREEQGAITQLEAEGLNLGELPGALAEALASGLTDPTIEERVREDGR